MKNKKCILALMIFLPVFIFTQHTPWVNWTLLPKLQMAEIVGETSGETAWNTIMETGGYNKDRLSDEYKSTFFESAYILKQLKKYGVPGAEIVRYKRGTTWDGIKGDLWEISPKRQKLASFQDVKAMLAPGSMTADVKAELVWIGKGTKKDLEGLELENKIVVTDGSMRRAHLSACRKNKALGVIAITARDPYFDPTAIYFSGINGKVKDRATFGFTIPVRDGQYLKNRLLRGDKIKVHAQVESTKEPYEHQNVTAYIPGENYPDTDEIIFSAHLFEGLTKQGGNDNKSGSAGILEVARVLHKLIKEGRLPKPKRTIRFLWGPEYSGTGLWIKDQHKLMEKTLCNINMDMVGESLKMTSGFMCLMRTTFANSHYINDVVENYYRFVGEGNREKINLRSAGKFQYSVTAPTGTQDPFYYKIDTHYGASDHEVFNNWSVGVPGIMMIVWPDPWYHTSEDTVLKSDPTQLKRVAVIGAASAYTIASADDAMIIEIIGEITANATRRLGHKFNIALEKINKADKEQFARTSYEAANVVKYSMRNEIDTLQSTLELSQNKRKIKNHLKKMEKIITNLGQSYQSGLKAHVAAASARLKVKVKRYRLSEEEKKAAKIFPRTTTLVKKEGYRGYTKHYREVTSEFKKSNPYNRREISNINELEALINGKRSILDIINILDIESSRKSELKSVMNYIKYLKEAGLVEFKK